MGARSLVKASEMAASWGFRVGTHWRSLLGVLGCVVARWYAGPLSLPGVRLELSVVNGCSQEGAFGF